MVPVSHPRLIDHTYSSVSATGNRVLSDFIVLVMNGNLTIISNFEPGFLIVKKILARYSKLQILKARQVRAIFFDVDGVLTDGKIIYDSEGRELKMFDVKDGLIVSYLKKAGILLGAITGRETPAVAQRMHELKVDFCHQGITDKADVCRKLMKHYNLKSKETAYIGDDINDLPVFDEVGFAVCPADAPVYVRDKADLVTFAKGGQGSFRELADLILIAQSKHPVQKRS